MENTKINQNNGWPEEIHLFPRIDRVVGALKHLVFRYPDEPFASRGDHFIPEPKEL